jgi:hypothetical protein
MTAPDRDLRGWAGPAAGLSFVAGVVGAAVRASDPYPRPWATPSEVQTYFTGNRAAARTSVAGQLASAAALGIFTATVSQRARRDHRPAHARAARAAGTLAAASLATSAASSLLLTTRTARDPAAAHRLHQLGFTAGGPVHTVTFGALVGTLASDPCAAGTADRALRTVSLLSATAGALSPLYYVARPFGWLIFASRFLGLGAVAAAGIRMAGRAR